MRAHRNAWLSIVIILAMVGYQIASQCDAISADIVHINRPLDNENCECYSNDDDTSDIRNMNNNNGDKDNNNNNYYGFVCGYGC